MSAAPASTGEPADMSSSAAASTRPNGRLVILGLVLVAGVIVAGSPQLEAPWILGDEFVFIVGNPNVNPAADPARNSRTLANRLAAIVMEIHDDLYQPLPILTYAVEWELTGGNVTSFRRTDVLLHALNALLLWWVLTRLLRRVTRVQTALTPVIAWCLAWLWALHPALVTAWASDMGRTHLLSTTLTLCALLLYLRTLATGRNLYFLGSVAAILLAMLTKVVAGWVLLVLVLEASAHGWRRALTCWRVYVSAAICAGFAVLTIYTSTVFGFAVDASKGLFGDPVARSALAVWIYFRDLVAPLWLTFWHLPDPRTGWTYPLVWAGLALTLASVWHALRSWRAADTRVVAIGWAWCWALLLPVLGLVGAREVAAVDRYLYQPLMGIMVVVGVTLLRWGATSSTTARTGRIILPLAAALGLVMLLWDLPQCSASRSSISRAKRVVRLYPDDPRGLEALAAGYEHARSHALPAADLAAIPVRTDQFTYFHHLWQTTLVQAASAPNLDYFFRGPDDRGPFHRRLSFRFLRAGLPEQSLAEAQEAYKLLPDQHVTWVRLAQAYRALDRFNEAADAYDHAEKLLPDDSKVRAIHYADYGYMLMFDLERDAEACAKFDAAPNVVPVPLPLKLGLATCQIRYGDGARGFQLVSEVMYDPQTQSSPALAVQAGLVLAEYHLRSHHWQEAGTVYSALLRDDSTDYAALRGFTEVCLQVDRAADAVKAWRTARQAQPQCREFRSFVVWATALAIDDEARREAETLLTDDPDNQLACMGLALISTRAGDPVTAAAWVDRAARGQPIPKARAFERAAAAVQILVDRGKLPPEAVIVQAAILAHAPPVSAGRARARELLDDFVAKHPDSPWSDLVERLRRELSDAKTRS